MFLVRLPETTERRLDQLARRTGRSKAHCAREAILAHIEELECIYFAETHQSIFAKEGRNREPSPTA
jgi:RHH-type rel operon transcriptional repressor/antitoxin RelB